MGRLKSLIELAARPGFAWGLGLLLFLTALVANLEPPRHDTLWFHLRMGREIASTGSVPHHTSFLASQSTFEAPYFINDSWAFDWLVYQAEQAAGLPGLALLKSFLLALTAVMAFLGCLLAGASAGLAGLLVTLDMWVTRSLYPLQPLLFTDLLLASQMLLLLAQEKSRRCFLPWCVVPLYALWANLDGGFLAGLLCLGVWWLGECLPGGRTGVPPRWLGWSLASAGLAALAGPESWRIYPYVFHALLHPEGNPLALGDLAGPAGTLLATIAVAFLGSARAGKLRWPHLLVSLCLVYLAVRHAPSIGQLGVGATPLTAAAFASWLGEPLRFRLGAAWLSAAILLAVLLSGPVDRRWTDLSPRRDLFPEQALEFLTKRASGSRNGSGPHLLDGGVLFNSIDQGGYLVYRDAPALIHGVSETYPVELMRDYQALLRDPRPEQLAKYKVAAFLLRHTETEDALAQRLVAEGWSLVYSDELSMVLVQKGPNMDTSKFPPNGGGS